MNLQQYSNQKAFSKSFFSQNNIFYERSRTIIRNINPTSIQAPMIHTIYNKQAFSQSQIINFSRQIIIDSRPPVCPISKCGQIKNQITEIQQIWSSHIKDSLNDMAFVEISRNNNSLSNGEIRYGKSIIDYEKQEKVFSRAYFKILEILDLQGKNNIFFGKQQKPITIGMLAEGPGGFIHAIIDYRLKKHNIKDQICAITLKISKDTRNAKDWSYYPCQRYISKQIKNGHTINLSYGSDSTGNLLKLQNIDYFSNITLKGQKCHLVTADGGIQCILDQQFTYQQIFNAKLFYAEVLAALKIQQVSGFFVLKIYDMNFQITKQIILLLCCFYESVEVMKPTTSRPANSEKYLFCSKYKGISLTQMKELEQILNLWTQIQPNLSYFENKQFVLSILDFEDSKIIEQIYQQIGRINQIFLQEQADKLAFGIRLNESCNNNQNQIQSYLLQKRYQEQLNNSYFWCQKHNLNCIPIKIQKVQKNKIANYFL